MRWRLGIFLLWLAAGAIAGWVSSARDLRMAGVLAGMLGAVFVWFAIDFARGSRLLRWLRDGASGDPPALHGAWGEVAARIRRFLREHRRRLRASDDRLKRFLEAIQASPNGVVLLDADDRIEWCSQTAANHLGLDARRDLLQHIGNLVRAPVFVAHLAGGDWQHEVVIESPCIDAPRACRLSLQLHAYGDGRKLLLSRDVTALEQAEAMRRDFVADVSHEIRSPLTVVAGFVETLQSLPPDAENQKRYLDLMAQQTSRMQALVNDLLALSRLEGSPPPAAGEWTAAGDLMEQIAQEARSLSEVLCAPAAGRAHELVFEGGKDFEIAGSRAELRSAIGNLVNNAVRYTPPGGRIHARFILWADGRAEFSVRDNGPGIAPGHLSRLTERFYRIDRSRARETGGTGLGLAIVKHVAQRHGAELRIESSVGKGSCFALVFPAGRVREIDVPAIEKRH